MLDLGGADAKSQGAQSAVRTGMGIAANYRHARQGGALFGTDDVHDTLTQVIHAEFGDAVFFAVGVQRVDLQAGNGILYALLAVGRGHVVVGHGKIGPYPPRLAPGQAKALKCLRSSEENTSEPQSLMSCPYAVFSLKTHIN